MSMVASSILAIPSGSRVAGSSAAPPDSLALLVASRGRPIELGAQQRVVRSSFPENSIVAVRDGHMTIDVCPTPDRRQILDFLAAGDLVPLAAWSAPRNITFRATARTTLLRVDLEDIALLGISVRHFEGVLRQTYRQLSRLGLNQLIVGQPEAEARVASFLLTRAYRNRGRLADGIEVSLPMTRDDIANHLALNRDTLSRIMARFETQEIITRLNRHLIVIKDASELARNTSLATLLRATFEADAG